MAQKKDIPVIINGKVYTLSGYESEEYLQSIAMYINNKITECKSSEHYRKLNTEYQGVLLALNIADDYFKVKKQAEESVKVEDEKEKQLYDLRHEVIETRIKQESALKLVEEYKEQVNALQRKIIQLEAENDRSNKK
ncbi:MAG: cell division protein ZapA [Lachnospiraceae bacterium]|nr:cell division protein ZapA [Lachnospiraceae bacterium]